MTRWLSGWQRLWIAASALYLLGLVAFCHSKWPSTADAERLLFDDVWQQMRTAEAGHYGTQRRTLREYVTPPSDWVTNRVNEGEQLELPYGTHIAHLEDRIRRKEWLLLAETIVSEENDLDFSRHLDKYQARIDVITTERQRLLLRALLYWIVPVTVVIMAYGVGWSVGWVRRGFQSRTH